jgi:hypothetical protein
LVRIQVPQPSEGRNQQKPARFACPAAGVVSARHLVIARVVGDARWVLAYARDSMVDDLADRIGQGEGEVDPGL